MGEGFFLVVVLTENKISPVNKEAAIQVYGSRLLVDLKGLEVSSYLFKQVYTTIGVTPLIVIPGDELKERVRQTDT